MADLMNRKGFTLVESMVVFAIIAVLASLLTQALPFLRENTRDSRRLYELDNLRRQIELYKNENGQYPATDSGGGVFYSFFTNPDAFSGTYAPALVTANGLCAGDGS